MGFRWTGFGVVLAAMLAVTGGSVVVARAPEPAAVACPAGLAGEAECYAGQDANGAEYAVAIPKHWNGSLVVHAHGGPDLGDDITSPTADLDGWSVLVEQGYAWAGSSYRRGGYGVRMAAADTEDVRRRFVRYFGAPRRTYLHGDSYGGNVAAKAAEVYPHSYSGVLLTSGLLAGGSRGYNARVDLRVVYQYYCRNLPRPDEPQYPLWQGLPKDSALTADDVDARLEQCTGLESEHRTPLQQRNLDDIRAVTRIPQRSLRVHLLYATFLFQDIVWDRLGGRNPFSNQGVQYTGSHDDTALNEGVARFDADPTALRDLSYDSDLTGRVSVPVLTLHAIGDPQVFVENESAYRQTLRGGDLVQTFTTETRHSGLSPAEYVAALTALDAWASTGRKPTPRSIADSCHGGCHYDPGYRPPPFATRFRPRPGQTSWPALTPAREEGWSRIAGVGIQARN